MEAASVQNPSLTPSQQRAVAARGNVLVMAGAGTGKTKTLIERCLDCLDRERVELDELLIVTFTEAAAAEMRQRLRKKLEEQAAAHPADDHWQNQLALFDTAHIGTLHSFCLRLVREHFYELGLDPQFIVLDEGEARQRADEVLDELFQSHYVGEDELSVAVQNLIQVHGGGRDESIRKLVLRLHNYSQARPDAAGWLTVELGSFLADEPMVWRDWLHVALTDWRDEWLSVLDSLKSENVKAGELAKYLSRLSENFTQQTVGEVLDDIIAADLTVNYPKGQTGKLRLALGVIFSEAKFLRSLCSAKDGNDPLAEDWNWVRQHMVALLRLSQEFAVAFSQNKLGDGVLDFHDLEQLALKLLWDFEEKKPTATAESWRQKLRFVFVDEYQDINAAQDKIIQALSREVGNRFLVGDVKQSIYRFRLADPKIFRDYARAWRSPAGETIPLSQNFRSREGLLNFVNAVCRVVMREEVGGVGYDREAKLQFGSPQTRADLSAAQDSSPRVELLLRRKTGRNDLSEDADGELPDIDEAQKEARLVALRLKKLQANKYEIWDEPNKTVRAIKWSDMTILLRSPRGKSEIYVKEFERVGIPLAVSRGGFYQSAEILDLLSLLQLLDNPLQDVPCIAVLRSPVVGLSLDELAEIRLAAKGHYWTALNRFHALTGETHFPLTLREREERSQSSGKTEAEFSSSDSGVSEDSQRLFPLPEGEGWGEGGRGSNLNQSRLAEKISQFLNRFSRWRKLAKQNSLSQCLEIILEETLYADWLRAQPRGAQRAANMTAFLHLAQQFDQFQRQGLLRFLKFIEAQQEAEVEPEVSATPTENAVQLMSIHQSKGLEFPVVVLADLAKRFNEQDLHGEIIFDEELGLCPKVKPPASGRRYPSLPHWLAQRRQRRELRGEELRLLYVALTRAREHLILTATVSEKNWDEVWTKVQPETVQKIASARSFADWLALWFAQNVNGANSNGGETSLLCWRLIEDAELEYKPGRSRGDEAQTKIANHRSSVIHESEPPRVGAYNEQTDLALDGTTVEKLRARLSWNYPFFAATERKAKSSVTALRREAEESDDEAEQILPVQFPARRFAKSSVRQKSGLSASQIGAAHHIFLQHVALDKTDELAAEVERLVRENYLSVTECAALDLNALGKFWDSELGRNICANAASVRRELPFTARFGPDELAKITGIKAAAGLKDEYILVQGVADLAVLLPKEIWLVDFKTDAVNAKDLPGKIKTYTPQLRLYASAFEKIFHRKVTRRVLHFLALSRSVEV